MHSALGDRATREKWRVPVSLWMQIESECHCVSIASTSMSTLVEEGEKIEIGGGTGTLHGRDDAPCES